MSNNKSNETISIDWSRVATIVESLRRDADETQSKFEEYGASVKRAGAEDAYYGSSSESFQQAYVRLKPRLDEFVDLIRQFATIIESAGSDTAAGEAQINKAAQSL